MYNFFKSKKSRLQVNISIDYQDNISIDYKYNKNDIDNSYKMATLLYSINHGLLISHFIESLTKEKNNEFSMAVIDKWNLYNNISNSKNNEPIVKPLNAFFKNVK